MKVVDSYFKNEDEALSAQAELKKMGATRFRIERLLGEDDETEMPQIAYASPAYPTSTTAEASTVTNSRMPLYQFFSAHGGENEAKALLSYHIDPANFEQSLLAVQAFGGKIQ